MNKNSLNIRQQDHVTYMENEDKIIRILNSNGLYLKKMQGGRKVGSQFWVCKTQFILVLFCIFSYEQL